MDKEEIIRRLKALEEGLPEGLKATANATDVIEDLNSYVLEYNLKFNEEKEKENIYDEVAVEKEEATQRSLEADLQQLDIYKVNINLYREDVEKEIAKLERSINSAPNRIAYLDSVADKYNDFGNITSMIQNKARIIKEKEEFQKNIEEKKAILAEKQKELAKIMTALEINTNSIVECQSDFDKTKARIDELKNINVIPESRMDKYEKNLSLLNNMSNYFNANPKSKLDEIISDFESGKIDEEAVNEQLQTIKSMLTSNIYNVKNVNAKLSPTQLEEKKKEITTQIEILNARLEDANNERYSAEIQKYYDENSLLESDLEELERNNNKNDRIINENNKKIEKFEQSNDKLKVIRKKYEESKDLSQDAKQTLISNIDREIFDNNSEIEILNIRNKSLNNKFSFNDMQIEKIHSKMDSNRNEINNLLAEAQLSREIEKSKIMKELMASKALLETLEVNGELYEESFEKGLDSLINLTGGETLNKKGEIILPPFVKDLTPKQMKIYEELLKDLSEEEKEEVVKSVEEKLKEIPESEIKKISTTPIEPKNSKTVESERSKVKEEKPELGLAPYVNPKSDMIPIPDGPKQKVKGFKTIAKEKLDEVKDWFKKNWKKATVIASTVVLVGALALTGKCSSNKNDKVVSITPQQSIEISIPYEKPDVPEAIPYPTDAIEPEIGIGDSVPEEKPNKPSTPSKPETPITPEIPVPEVTPPAPVNPSPNEPVVNEYYLDTGINQTTGNSAPADSEEAHLQGESVYNPVTHTWIDSNGTKITQTEDGEFVVETNAEEVTPVDEDTNKITNPDMTPLEAPLTEEEAKEEAQSFEEAVEDGTLSAAEAQEYQDFFDDLFNQMEEEKGRGR